MDVRKGAILVPQRAVTELQGSYQVAVVGADDKVTIRVVKTGPLEGSMWIIEEGLKPGDRVIVEGLQRVRTGMTVVPKEASSEPAPAAEAAAEDRDVASWVAFFVHRPIVAIVIAILMTMAGLVAMTSSRSPSSRTSSRPRSRSRRRTPAPTRSRSSSRSRRRSSSR